MSQSISVPVSGNEPVEPLLPRELLYFYPVAPVLAAVLEEAWPDDDFEALQARAIQEPLGLAEPPQRRHRPRRVAVRMGFSLHADTAVSTGPSFISAPSAPTCCAAPVAGGAPSGASIQPASRPRPASPSFESACPLGCCRQPPRRRSCRSRCEGHFSFLTDLVVAPPVCSLHLQR